MLEFSNLIGRICLTLVLIFVVLKLVGVISWSWWYVLSPIAVSMGFGFLIVLPYLIWKQAENDYWNIR